MQATIRLVGFQPRELCIDLRRASVLSLCLMGGFSLIEACAAGVPVIAYDVEWHSELVKSCETGFLVREGDVNGLLKAVEYLLEHPNDASVMGSNARKLAFERHGMLKASEIKQKCYMKLCERYRANV